MSYLAHVDGAEQARRPPRHEELVSRPRGDTRARRHAWALIGLWVWQSTLALAAAWPAASLVGAAYGAGPRGDAPLWDAGGHALLDFLWHAAWGLRPVTAAGTIAILAGAVAGLVPLAAVMVAMSHTTRAGGPAGLVRSVTGALRSFPSFSLLLVMSTVAQAAVVGLGAAVAAIVQAVESPVLGPARAGRLGIAFAVVFVAAASAVVVVHDLARAVLVQSPTTGLRALLVGARLFGRAPLPTWWSWAWRMLSSLLPVLAVAMVADRMGGRGGFTLALLAVLHQAVVAARVALRMSWLAHALRSVPDQAEASCRYSCS